MSIRVTQIIRANSGVDRKQEMGYSTDCYLACQGKDGNNKMASHKVTASLYNDRGIWTVKGRVFDPNTGKVIQRTKSTGLREKDHTERKAKAMMKDIVAEWEREANSFQRTENPSFETCVNQWLEHKKLTIRSNTLVSYEYEANKYIIPMLGKIGICDLKRRDIQDYYEHLQREGLSVNTMKKHRVIIRGTLRDAVLDDLIPINVADNVILPKGKRYEGNALTEEQVSIVLKALEEQEEPIKSVITLALTFGLRRSEICGLRWEDVDLTNQTLHICNTVTDYAGTIYESEDTKTSSSNRVLYIPDATVEFFRRLKASQEENGIHSSKVCVWPDGREVKPMYITRASKRFLESCGIEGIRLHDLRGTVGTYLAKNVPIQQVKDYLGHKDIQTTLKYYVHTIDKDKIATANAMANFLESCSGNCSGSPKMAKNNVIAFSEIATKKYAKALK